MESEALGSRFGMCGAGVCPKIEAAAELAQQSAALANGRGCGRKGTKLWGGKGGKGEWWGRKKVEETEHAGREEHTQQEKANPRGWEEVGGGGVGEAEPLWPAPEHLLLHPTRPHGRHAFCRVSPP